uniref:AraC family transcriptional regulator n=1 Tax=uncultured Christiangramia sp. TaxID=503836 RepID=UPI002619CB9C|nr:helix-turn-helix domain-containing protein [uncultured Christiangramia sp.]
MYSKNSQDRLQEILDFITEITLGNYTYTLSLKNQKSELEQIVLSLNTMVEEIDTSVHQINFEKSKEVIENIVFTLDHNLHIISYSDNVSTILKYPERDLINKPIKLILSENTKLPEDIYELSTKSFEQNLPFQVSLLHTNGYIWSGYGYFHRMISKESLTYTLSVFKEVYINERMNINMLNQQTGAHSYPSEYRSLLLQDQRDLGKRLHKYVTQRLDRKLKKLDVISREVGGSTSKIKIIFKRAYGETIYAYHLRKRLEKAYTLLKDTSTPINEIAEECGFKSFSHFSRSFKNKYHITATQIRKS